MELVVLRMGHRIHRDERVTTHVCLTARAFGCDGVIISGQPDEGVKKSVEDVVRRFGGKFFVEIRQDWMNVVKSWLGSGGEVVHLTMYGLPLPSVIEEIRSSEKNKLIVVGSEKVPKKVYEMATWNVSVTNQPISEVAALAVFLDWLQQHREFYMEFENAKIKVIPSAREKKVVRLA
ncbi:MAG: tRNA (cytidine(56)-2'-O)-methyltransferase [Candidatus Terraquivivens tikiterensis]|uniref:tRNA (cytidine(56)-2'-O)-methyltransferase n=1 Tax=Candidatus Terraquivivens tikiterensis TaxID=1980982 RepID=A0A2R7Y187_9ARCH|nr:MAG: tRNA (cytidine(56)-2'-O)-methyltransferase [Candidatus Terraquivivens tikiterensis]